MEKQEYKKYIEDYIKSFAKNYPGFIDEKMVEEATGKYCNMNLDVSNIIKLIDSDFSDCLLKAREEVILSFDGQYSNNGYENTTIKNIDISLLNYKQLDQMFFHYSWNKYLEIFDKEGMKPIIGENSKGIDKEQSIFFSIGVEGVLELWDVWLKWRMNRLYNPQFFGLTEEEKEYTNFRFKNGLATEEEKEQYKEWEELFGSKKALSDPKLLAPLFEYQYKEMVGSDYFALDLKENEEFSYSQEDIKKVWSKKEEAQTGKINPITLTQMGEYTDFSTTIADKWNMQTIPGKDFVIEPDRIRRLNVEGKFDVFSIVDFLYRSYKKEKPLQDQVKFDVLDSYMEYVNSKYIKNDKFIQKHMNETYDGENKTMNNFEDSIQEDFQIPSSMHI